MAEEPKKPRPVWRHQTARFVVSVDNQAKSSFENRDAADKEAKRISDAFPKLTVAVSDLEHDSLALSMPAPVRDDVEG